jgi:hypothetical protein
MPPKNGESFNSSTPTTSTVRIEPAAARLARCYPRSSAAKVLAVLKPHRPHDLKPPHSQCPAATSDQTGDRAAQQPLRGVFATIAHLHVRQFRVLGTVWLTRFRCIIAEPEAPGARFADRPAAGDDTAVRPRRWRCNACNRNRRWLRSGHRCHPWHHRLSRAPTHHRRCAGKRRQRRTRHATWRRPARDTPGPTIAPDR